MIGWVEIGTKPVPGADATKHIGDIARECAILAVEDWMQELVDAAIEGDMAHVEVLKARGMRELAPLYGKKMRGIWRA